MSNIGDFLKSKEFEKREICKQNEIFVTIIRKCKEKNIDDVLPTFNFSIGKKEEIENRITALYGWVRTPSGFEYRNNFRLNDTRDDILFDRYFITKNGDKFESDGSEISNAFMKKHARTLNSLMKIYQVYDALAERFKDDIDKEMESYNYTISLTHGDSRITEMAYYKTNHTRKFIAVYGEVGKRLLIKWLNELSNPNKSIEELTEEYAKDVELAGKCFYEYLYKNENNAYVKFEYFLLQELLQYSPRGAMVRWMYRRMMENGEKKFPEKTFQMF